MSMSVQERRHALPNMTTAFCVTAMVTQKKLLKKLSEFHSANIPKNLILMRLYQVFQIFTKIFAKAIDKSNDFQYNTANKSNDFQYNTANKSKEE